MIIIVYNFRQQEIEEYGIDWCGPAVIIEDEPTVSVPATIDPQEPHELVVLETLVDPLDECDDLGVAF